MRKNGVIFDNPRLLSAIVFGASGFIGSTLVQELLKAGVERVLAVSSYHHDGKTGLLRDQLGVEIVRGDVRDKHFLETLKFKAMNWHLGGPTLVFNCAALVSVPFSLQMPDAYLETNLLAVSRMLNVFSGERFPFVQVSTSEVFDGQGGPYTASSPLSPVSPYGATKAMSEMLVRGWRALYGPHSVVCRLFNTYGPGQSPRAVIPKMVLEAMAVKERRKKRADLGDPNGQRSFMHVVDSAKALMAASMLAMAKGGSRKPLVQACADRPTGITELWWLVAKAIGIPSTAVNWDVVKRPLSIKVPKLRGSVSPALRSYGIGERSVSLQAGIRQVHEWLQANRGYYNESEYQ